MGGHSQFRILQVSNISPAATKDEIHALFSYIGRIDECRIYPSSSSGTTAQTKAKFAFIKFEKEKSVELGQHLSNVVFIDRALICVPTLSNTIPDEESAIHEGVPAPPGLRQLPADVKNEEKDYGDGQIMIETIDPTLTALGLPPYPPLPAATDPAKIEEIRRTVYIGNLAKNYDGDDFMNFINATMGEVMYLRMAQDNDHLPCGYAYVEFSNIRSVAQALQNNGIDYNGRALRIQHSRVAILKPQRKTADQALEEVEEAIKINEGKATTSTTSAVSSRRRSPSPRKRSRDREDRHRSSRVSRRKRSHSRKRSKSRDRKRSNSRSRKRSKSRDRKRSNSRSRKRSKSRDRKRSHSRSRKRSKSRERKRSRSRDSRRRSTSRDRRSKPFEEEVLRERLLERVKRKSTMDDGGTESLLVNFKPEPKDTN